MNINETKTLTYKGINIEIEKDDDEIDLLELFIDQIFKTNNINLVEIKKIRSNIDLKWKNEIPAEYKEGRSIILNLNSRINYKHPLYINTSEIL